MNFLFQCGSELQQFPRSVAMPEAGLLLGSFGHLRHVMAERGDALTQSGHRNTESCTSGLVS